MNREKKYPTFHQLLHNLFGEWLQHQTFLEWLAKKLDIRPSKFSIYVQRWRENNFEESRGQNYLPIESEQAVYNTWLKNSIVSTNGRNGRNEISISKRQYLQMCGEIRSDLIELTEKKNKRVKMMVCGPRRIATCTLKTLKEKFLEKNIGVSMVTVLSLRPFFITFATEKRMALCLCNICLNAWLLFEPLMCQAKKDKNMTIEYITEFFIFNCQCLKSESRYF